MVGFFRNVVPADRLHADRGLQARSCCRTAASTSAARTAPSATTRSRGWCRTSRTASRCTAWQLVAEGRPFTDVLTTTAFMMTTALKSLYIQIEMPTTSHAFGNADAKLAWKIDYSGTAIPIEQTLTPARTTWCSATRRPAQHRRRPATPTCAAAPARRDRARTTGYVALFQRLLGFTPRFAFAAQPPTCCEHASKPYFTADDVTDWQLGDHRAARRAGDDAGDPALRPAGAARGDRRWRCRCRASASTRRRRSWRCGTPTTATSTA